MFNLFQKKTTENSRSIIISLGGLHCSSCAVNIDLALEDLSGVVNSKTNYAKSTSVVDFEPEKIDPKKILTEIKKLGYEAGLID